jgi:hypothetical protein
MVHPNVSWDLLHSVQVKNNPLPSPRWHNNWLIFLIARYTPNLKKVSSPIFDVIGFVLGTKCIIHSNSSQMKKLHVIFLIWIGEVTKIRAIKRCSQQCPTSDDRKGWVNLSLT